MVSDTNFILKSQSRKHSEKLKRKGEDNADFPFYKLLVAVFHSVWPVKQKQLKNQLFIFLP